MARFVTYTYKGEARRIPFSYSQFHDAFDAIATAEGIDLTAFYKMEQQLAASTRDKAALRNFRDKEIARLGISNIYLHKDEPSS